MLGSDDTTTTPTVQAPTPAAPLPTPPPAWRPRPDDRGRTGPFVLGVIVLLIGLWFFATATLGLDLPRIEWRQAWPLILIAIGIWIVARSFGRAR
jgi:hypothetical protein